MRARTATPDEREELWPRLVEIYADFENYQRWTERQIPVVICAPVTRAGADCARGCGVGDNGAVGRRNTRGSRPCLIAKCSESEKHPVVAGLLALVGVGLAVGLIAGLAALVGVQVLGLGDAGASDRATAQQSLYIPRPRAHQAVEGAR